DDHLARRAVARARERVEHEQHGGGAVVHDQRVLGAGRRAQQRAEPVEGYVGGGTLPLAPVASIALAWRAPGGADAAAARLRAGTPPVVARVEDDRVLIDLRTVPAERDGELTAALEAAR
ncbi:MAG TPA: hypothetical protein VFF00_09035, partial [Candidatus Elarobacter sp.]|nr:hypothetical protein [Candidatus Elarobacter sp.]